MGGERLRDFRKYTIFRDLRLFVQKMLASVGKVVFDRDSEDTLVEMISKAEKIAESQY